MLKIIVGQNAIGKSVYIKSRANEALKENKDTLCNIWDSKYLKNKKYNKDRIEALYDVLDADEILENKECLSIKTDVFEISQSLISIITLVCKEGKLLYLDEPEYGLNNREIGILVAFLYKILDTFNDIEIVTHSELFLGIQEAKILTVILDENDNYITAEIGEDAYGTID